MRDHIYWEVFVGCSGKKHLKVLFDVTKLSFWGETNLWISWRMMACSRGDSKQSNNESTVRYQYSRHNVFYPHVDPFPTTQTADSTYIFCCYVTYNRKGSSEFQAAASNLKCRFQSASQNAKYSMTKSDLTLHLRQGRKTSMWWERDTNLAHFDGSLAYTLCEYSWIQTSGPRLHPYLFNKLFYWRRG